MCKKVTHLQNKNFADLNPLVYGNHQCPPLHTSSFEHSKYLLLHYVVSGTGTVVVNGKRHNVSAGEAFLRLPDCPITYTADKDNPWHYRWIIFNGNLSSRFYHLPPIFRCSKEPFDQMEKVFELQSMQEEYLASCLFRLYIALFQNKRTENPVLKVINYLELNFHRPVRIEKVAEQVNLNRHYLSRIFRKETGMSMQDYLTRLRMLQAEEYLRRGLTVGETAAALSYSDQFVFSKAFKQYFGFSPSKLRGRKQS